MSDRPYPHPVCDDHSRGRQYLWSFSSPMSVCLSGYGEMSEGEDHPSIDFVKQQWQLFGEHSRGW